jgi:hypothetical protein
VTDTPEANEPRTRATSRLIIGLLVGATVAAVAFVGISVATRDPATVHSFTIDAGTRDLLDAGKEVPNPPPVALEVELGDTLEVTNNDSSVHTYAFLVLRPGETGRYTFRNRGVFSGQCTASDHGEITITVT